MHVLNQSIDPAAAPRPLTSAEIDQVTGGVLPVLAGAIVTMVIASVVNSFTSGDDESEEEEKSDD